MHPRTSSIKSAFLFLHFLSSVKDYFYAPVANLSVIGRCVLLSLVNGLIVFLSIVFV
ncbi:hypothetical protein EMIT0P294_50152 [Pseudomonas sp. IT-P294]